MQLVFIPEIKYNEKKYEPFKSIIKITNKSLGLKGFQEVRGGGVDLNQSEFFKGV